MVYDDIYEAKRILSLDIDESRAFYRLYNFSNENLYGYMKDINFKEKKVLTCGSSCDQILNLIDLGCRDITLFDINPFVKYYYNLKCSLIKNVTIKEYLFFLSNRNYLWERKNREIYDKIKDDLDTDARIFWDQLFLNYGFSYVNKCLFIYTDSISKKNIISNNSYLRNNLIGIKNINNLQIDFIHDDLGNLRNIDKKYDYIFLSNIIDYLYGFRQLFSDNYDEKFSKCIEMLKKLDNYLTVDGEIYFYYVWICNEWNNDYIFEKYMKDIPGINKKVISNSSGLTSDRDCVYTYKKLK